MTSDGGRPGADVVCLGETMAMVVPREGQRLDARASLRLRAGGAESNVAMYLADLGHVVQWVSRVGRDPFGQLIVEEVRSANVLVDHVATDDHYPTGIYFKDPQGQQTDVYYYRSESAATQMGPELSSVVDAVGPRIVHLTGITPALSASCRKLVEKLIFDHGRAARLVSFDVNFRPALWRGADGSTYLRELAQACDIVFVGLDEAYQVWGSTSADQVRAVIDQPRWLIVKDGSRAATCFHPHGRETVPTRPQHIVEPTGAGDAFAAGWLSGLLHDIDEGQRLELGHRLARIALSSLEDHGTDPRMNTPVAHSTMTNGTTTSTITD